ncbi:MAG: LacI family DNA-binding transcriptional regulator [Bacilli bacterium]|nr:LacI family DNA-binding transcriptional regulator [Bacilli bacterium]
MKKPTLDQIAIECGVTKGLVSRALGGKNNVSDATREKIIRKATELGYDTSKLKVHKVSSNRVLLIGSSRILFKEDFWQPIITAISSTLSRSNLIVEYFAFEEDKIDDGLLKKLKESSCSAFIIIHVAPQEIVSALANKGKPLVIVDPKTFHSEATQFKFSNYDSAYLAVQRLIEQGHTNIAFYGSDSHSLSFRERHEGYMACMENHKAEAKQCSIIFNNEKKNYADEQMLIDALNSHPITAIVCANDIIALNAIKTINRLGKKVPEDISVVGFDNIRTGDFMTPRLSTFNIPRQEIGEEVAKYVANSIKSHQIPYSQIVIRCDFIERESNIEVKK